MRLGRNAIVFRPLVLLLVVVACSTSTDPDRDVGISPVPNFQTDSAAYTLRATDFGYEGMIRATFTNWTTPTAYFGNCLGGTGVELQKRTAGIWTSVWSPPQLACLSPPITIPRDGQFQFVIRVFGGYPGGNYRPQFTIADVAGTYRAVWTEVFTNYQIQAASGEILPLEQRISNQFTIAVQPRP